ncbi:lysophospholipase [Nitzschia inconspicua]|uniref:Lysophospholipase n=1 Tax=Nitzschia inconspicua TaxID=303405 RepID=A0A9K3PN51_9STRA|nr:lysophospholipase [Nitzschia inconspicua]
MWGLDRLSTFLLAASSKPQPFAPESTVDMARGFRSIYQLLGEKAPVFQRYSPTIKFSYVNPPQQEGDNWLDDQVMMADADLMTRNEDNKTIFEQVAECNGNAEKPIALYLPGLDGYGISAVAQYNDLAKNFELWRMTVAVDDRTSFHELCQKPVQFVDDIVGNTARPVYVIGESFGGLLATAVGLQLHNREKRGGKANPVKGLVLVNPATSFDESGWDVTAPLLALLGRLTETPERRPFGLPSAYSLVGGLTLSALIPSRQQFSRIVDAFMGMESIRDPSRLGETMEGYLDLFQITSEFLPPGLLEHRIKNWLMVGTSIVDSRLSQLDIPSLVVVGTADQLISSKNEADRLTKLLPQAEKLQVREAGHFVLDDNVNLTEAILYSKLDPLRFKETKRPYDPIVDWKVPPPEIMKETLTSSVKQLEDVFSPIWMSTSSDGRRAMGLGNIPKEQGPILFVSNHQLLGVDLSILVAKLYRNGITVRGLGHPVLFQGTGQASPGASSGSLQRNDELGRVPGINTNRFAAATSPENYQKFGAVMVSPRNFYRLMETGQNALLFPGGVREVFHGKNESYTLFWPEKTDFVRTAAKFNATIIPVSAVGMADSFNILLDSKEIVDIPIFGQRAKELANNITAARFDMENQEESFLPPVVTPGLPSRNYFIFGKPYRTTDIDPKDKDKCKEAYESIQAEMRRGFDDILDARKKDLFKDAGPRFAYERLTGRQAPTFEIEEVNKDTKSTGKPSDKSSTKQEERIDEKMSLTL